MTGAEFKKEIQEHSKLALIDVLEGKTPDEDEVVVLNLETFRGIAIKWRSVLTQKWNDICDVLTGKREPVVMIGMTRIVGYYAQIRNFNGSKKAELRDRQKGNYAVADSGGLGKNSSWR